MKSEKTFHPDERWIKEKIDKHAGGYVYHLHSGPATITFIYGESKIRIFCLNMQLYFRWLKRVLRRNKGDKGGCVNGK